MNIINILSGVLKKKKELDIKKLPSQGLFYKDDLKIYIKKADMKDIANYENMSLSNVSIEDEISIKIGKIKWIVKNNVFLSKGYSYEDIKSIDIVYIFFEIVKYTNNKSINLSYYNDNDKEVSIEFNSKNFDYFKIDDKLMSNYDKKEKCFIVDGYKFSLPSIGIEDGIEDYLIEKSNEKNVDEYNNYFYDFTYFLGNKNKLSIDEVDNLIKIFNFDIEDKEIRKVENIIKKFEDLERYSLVDGENRIDLNSDIDLSKVWK